MLDVEGCIVRLVGSDDSPVPRAGTQITAVTTEVRRRAVVGFAASSALERRDPIDRFGSTYDATSEDNRQRLQVAAGVGGSTVRATLVGRDVTADDEGCGANRMKVYYAWFYEQSDHNDLDVDLDGAPVLDQVRPEG